MSLDFVDSAASPVQSHAQFLHQTATEEKEGNNEQMKRGDEDESYSLTRCSILSLFKNAYMTVEFSELMVEFEVNLLTLLQRVASLYNEIIGLVELLKLLLFPLLLPLLILVAS